MIRERRAAPMLRPERRRQLLTVAAQIITADGLSALTMANLAERAEIAKPVVYAHFANRNQVALALLDDHFSALRVFFGERLPKVATLGDYIAAVVDASFAFDSASKIPIRKITDGFSAGDEVNQAYLREYGEMRERLRILLELLGTPPEDATLGAAIINDMMSSSIRYFATKPGEHTEATRTMAKATLVRLVISCLKTLAAPDENLAARRLDFSDPLSRAPKIL